MNASIVVGAAGGKDVGDSVNGAGSNEHFWLDERDLAHGVEVEFGGEMGEGFEFFDIEISAEVVTEGIGEADKVGEGELFFEDFVFDADEDFLLGSATTKVATCGAMTSTGEAKSLFTVDGVFLIGLENGASIIIIFDVFVEGDGDATELIYDLDERAPVEMGVVLEINA